MKVFTYIEEFLGKTTYKDKRLLKLKDFFNPQKVTFISIDFVNEHKEGCDVIICQEKDVLDIIVDDLERLERFSAKYPERKELIEKVNSILNEQKFLYSNLSEDEKTILKEYGFTLKPIIVVDNQSKDEVIEKILKESGYIVFFTAGKKEVRGWLLEKGKNIVEAAGKIHTDLAKGFIKADVYRVEDVDNCSNLEELRIKGYMRSVDRDYIVEDGNVIEIKFSVSR